MTKEDRHRYQDKGEQLDVVMARSIVIETLYIAIRTILTSTEQSIETSTNKDIDL